ncbi:RNA degradosome polyphosphate kinase [Clostridium sp. WILCCON 0269]|uniref:Polyphosphate kinase n=1 Tax=Candidatus Clostridium eludens TaxID=3381663 RepID=A0ABW8SPR7_9CLOT
MSIYNSPKNFINRELSWLEFNERVLDEAKDNSNPLFERLKFASIVSSNLDEFFMVRVGSLSAQIEAGFNKPDPSGLTPLEQIEKISIRVHKLVHDQINCYNRSLKVSLKKENIVFLKSKELSEKQLKYLKEYYLKNIYPVLTPMVVDQSRPFPLILNRSLNIALLLQNDKKGSGSIFATIQVPSVLERFVEIPSDSENTNEKTFMFLEDIIKMNLNDLFSGYPILDCSCYRITRNADLTLDEEGAEDLLETIEESLKQRKWGSAVRLEIENGIHKSLLEILESELEISKDREYEINGPIDLTFLMKLSNIKNYEHLKYTPIKPHIPEQFSNDESIFSSISKGDILLHHPYEGFDPVINLVKEAASDSRVLAIKQTLYRVSGNSPIIDALIEAAENGKQVTVLVELKARFDEKNNIHWAKHLEKAGCHVIYGLVGLKTHCKILLVVRKEADGIKRYVHMATGNYNDITARLYTDLGLFTANPYFGADASTLFNMLSGYSRPTKLFKMSLAPLHLRDSFLYLINQEIENAQNGKKARIIIKINSLVDQQIIESLYKASCSGVYIDLIVRGICCLRPGIPGISEKISVRSIVGRFLEHSRIYYFYNDGEEAIYLSSADLMNRNLDRRVESLFPIEDILVKQKIKQILDISLLDTVKARILNSDGYYVRIDKRGKELIDSQKFFCNYPLDNNEYMNSYIFTNKWLEEGFIPVFSNDNFSYN